MASSSGVHDVEDESASASCLRCQACNDMLTPQHFVALATAPPRLPQLSQLDLSHNEACDGGARALATVLPSVQQLGDVDCRWNDSPASGVPALTGAAGTHGSCSINKNVGPRGCPDRSVGHGDVGLLRRAEPSCSDNERDLLSYKLVDGANIEALVMCDF